jgi:hypothetical protein
VKMTAADRFVAGLAREAESTPADLAAYFDGRAERARRTASECFEDAAQAAQVVETAAHLHKTFARRGTSYEPQHRNAYADREVRAASLDCRRRFDKGREYERHADACDRMASTMRAADAHTPALDVLAALRLYGYPTA